MVVGEQRAPSVGRGARSVQVVRRSQDRVVGIVDVAAHAVGRPRLRDELHRPLGSGPAGRSRAAELRLDEHDRGQHLPLHAEPPLPLAERAKKDARRRGRTGSELRGVAEGRGEGREVGARGDVGPRRIRQSFPVQYPTRFPPRSDRR